MEKAGWPNIANAVRTGVETGGFTDGIVKALHKVVDNIAANGLLNVPQQPKESSEEARARAIEVAALLREKASQYASVVIHK